MVVSVCAVNDTKWRVRRGACACCGEVVFYCSYRFNGVTDKHSNTELVDRNDLVLAALRRIAQSGGFFLFTSR